ncbi:MAG: RNA polymerase factor sigma-54 [Phycisphaerales bacterium]
MRFETSQNMRLGQQMRLAPRMIQSMEILQMPLAELQERIEQELESNATLELTEHDNPADLNGAAAATEAPSEPGSRDPDQTAELRVDATGQDDFARLDDFVADNPESTEADEPAPSRDDHRPDPRDSGLDSLSTLRVRGDADAKHEAMAAAPTRSASLGEQLLRQWGIADVEPPLRPLGELIIQSLDNDGYLRTPLETIADRAPAPMKPIAVDDLERAHTAVQFLLEPPGVAARDARECLLLQLDSLEDDDHPFRRLGDDAEHATALRVARELVEHHLDDLMQNRLPRISERTGLSLDDIKAGLALMRRLSLAPARRLIQEAPEPIIPDAVVEYDEDQDRYIAYLNERTLPALRINREYALMAKDREVPRHDRDFLKTNLSNAQFLIDAVEQRKRTLLRVIEVVVHEQREAFDLGWQAMKPLPMTGVAEQLGIHVATVSRAVADKHLETPRGIVPLRRFFTGGTQNEAGEDVSWDAIKAALKECIDAEDPASPLSDDALVDELKKRGLEIARRTVAKYRGQLGIPPARLRRKF